ncbi:MAG: hypothetical protein IJC64_03300 [Clostridia bacterium]|nr:hypothetical protein [Clostridia bacterium]
MDTANIRPEEHADASQDALLSEILQRFSQNSASPHQQSPPSSTLQPEGDIFSSLLQNPELLSNLPRLISIAKPLLETFMGQGNASPAAKAPHVDSDHRQSLPEPRGHDANRAALLCAMKPYLSPGRQTAIDYIIKLSRLGDILKTL